MNNYIHKKNSRDKPDQKKHVHNLTAEGDQNKSKNTEIGVHSQGPKRLKTQKYYTAQTQSAGKEGIKKKKYEICKGPTIGGNLTRQRVLTSHENSKERQILEKQKFKQVDLRTDKKESKKAVKQHSQEVEGHFYATQEERETKGEELCTPSGRKTANPNEILSSKSHLLDSYKRNSKNQSSSIKRYKKYNDKALYKSPAKLKAKVQNSQ